MDGRGAVVGRAAEAGRESLASWQSPHVPPPDDGAETDLDLGHYERFIDVNLTRLASITTGSVYREVIDKERRGDYDGAVAPLSEGAVSTTSRITG